MRSLFITAGLIFSLHLGAQTLTPEQYITQYKEIAIREMKRMGVPAAITLAQGLLETESGNSDLVRKSNNHFGIKCKTSWTASGVTHDDDALGECFRHYNTAEDSYRDHSNFLRGGDRYGFLFKLDPTDYRAWAFGLKKAGYATNPNYPIILIKNIEQYNLQQYSLAAAAEVPRFDASKYKDDKEEITTLAIEKKLPPNEGNNTYLDSPDKIIQINGSNCVLAGKGTSMLVIATKNHIALSKLLSYNELAEDGLLIRDQFVYLQKKARMGEKETYIVQSGETLYDISQKNGIQLQYLLDYNHLENNTLPVEGTQLLLRPSLVDEKRKVLNNHITTHVVAPKEGLYSIARKYHISIQQLKEWNKLHTDSLTIGQKLNVSGE